MRAKACSEGHVFGAAFLKEDQDHCPVCGLLLLDYELPAHKDTAVPVAVDDDSIAEPLSLLLANVLVTPQGKRLVLHIMKRIRDK